MLALSHLFRSLKAVAPALLRAQRGHGVVVIGSERAQILLRALDRRRPRMRSQRRPCRPICIRQLSGAGRASYGAMKSMQSIAQGSRGRRDACPLEQNGSLPSEEVQAVTVPAADLTSLSLLSKGANGVAAAGVTHAESSWALDSQRIKSCSFAAAASSMFARSASHASSFNAISSSGRRLPWVCGDAFLFESVSVALCNWSRKSLRSSVIRLVSDAATDR